MNTRIAAACLLAAGVFGAGCANHGSGEPNPAPGNATRPQLSASQIEFYSRTRVLGAAGTADAPQSDGWDPLAERSITGDTLPPFHYRVDRAAADGRSVFATVQAAVNRAHSEVVAGTQAAARIVIGVAPGSYRELVYVPAGRTPITIWGLGGEPAAVRIHAAVHAGLRGTDFRARLAAVYEAPDMHPDIAAFFHHCAANLNIGTGCSAVMWVRRDGFQLRNLTVQNQHDRAIDDGEGPQAVAFKAEGADRLHLEQVQLLGHQDTLFLATDPPQRRVRTFVHRSLVSGDVDFIFGSGTAYFLASEIRWVGHQRKSMTGYVAAPSTHLDVAYGFVFDDCDFTFDAASLLRHAGVHLARQWFVGARCSPYGVHGASCRIDRSTRPTATDGLEPSSLEAVGKMVVLRSRLGAHINASAPWSSWGTDRSQRAWRPAQYNSDDFWTNLEVSGHDPAALGYRRKVPNESYLGEYQNTGPGAAGVRHAPGAP